MSVQHATFFLRCVEVVVRTVNGDSEEVLRAADLPHQNSQFTVEAKKIWEIGIFEFTK